MVEIVINETTSLLSVSASEGATSNLSTFDVTSQFYNLPQPPK
jgi:hypothetical protein